MHTKILTTLLIMASLLLNNTTPARACSEGPPSEQTLYTVNSFNHLIVGTVIAIDLKNPVGNQNYKVKVVIDGVLKGTLKPNDTIEVYQDFSCGNPPQHTPYGMCAFLRKEHKYFWSEKAAGRYYPSLTEKPIENPQSPQEKMRNAAQKLLQQVIHQTGYVKHYYMNGNLEAEGYIADGTPQGYWKYYNKDGKLIEQGNYNEEGHKVDTWEAWYYERTQKSSKLDSLYGHGFQVYEPDYIGCNYPYKEAYSLYPDGSLSGRVTYTLLKPATVYGELDFYNEEYISLNREKDTLSYGYKKYDDALHSQTSYNVQYYPNNQRKNVNFYYEAIAKKTDSYGYEYAYNQQGTLIGKNEWGNKLNRENYSYLYTYNDKGVLINKKELNSYPNGNLITHIYEYNEQGILVNEKETIENNKQKK